MDILLIATCGVLAVSLALLFTGLTVRELRRMHQWSRERRARREQERLRRRQDDRGARPVVGMG